MIRRGLGRLLHLAGVDRAVFYTVLARGWSVFTGPVTLLMIASSLSLTQQGFYYTFSSLLALQVFFELGLSQILMQFASHEKTSLQFQPDGTLRGDPAAEARLASLFKLAMRWYSWIAVLVLVCVLPAGIYLFGRAGSSGVEWRTPWAWIVCIAAINILLTPIVAILTGCGLVTRMAFMSTWQSVATTLALWLALWLGWDLLALPFAASVAAGVGIIWLTAAYRRFVIGAFKTPQSLSLDWRSEVWPLQWRTALSWMSSYFVFQLFNPILFAYDGPAAAGRMGMSLNIAQVIWTTALSWVSTKAAPFGELVARKDFEGLDRLFFRALSQSLIVLTIANAGFLLAVVYLRSIGHPLGVRFLDPLPLAILLLTMIVNHVVVAEAIYLRAHKEEPFLPVSIVSAVLIGTTAYFLGRRFGATGMMIGYLASILTGGLALGTIIFTNKRRLWHAPSC